MPSGHIGSHGKRPCFSYCLPRLFTSQLTGHQIPRQLLIKFQKNSHLDEGDKHDQVAQEHSFHSSTSLSSSSSPPLSLLSSPLRFSFRLLPPFIPFPCLLPFPALLTTYSSLHSPCSRFSHHMCLFLHISASPACFTSSKPTTNTIITVWRFYMPWTGRVGCPLPVPN